MKRALATISCGVLLCAVLLVWPGMTPVAQAAYTPPALKVGLVTSAATTAWLAKHGRANYNTAGKQERVFIRLDEMNWNITYLHDADLSNLATLKKYDVIVLPYVFAIDPVPSKTLLRYVAEGGGLVSLFASPRVVPAYDQGAKSVWPEHWVHILGDYRSWEWGPLSEVYQAAFVDDPGTPTGYSIGAIKGSPIVEGARSILAQRGYSTANMNLTRWYSGGVELARLYPGNANAKPFLNLGLTKAMRAKYPKTYPAGLASQYQSGRAVYFYFCIEDFITLTTNPAPGLYYYKSGPGTPQGEVARAYIESAVTWAGTRSATPGKIVKGGTTYAKIAATTSAINMTQYVSNDGNSPTLGKVTFRMYNPAGKLVQKWIKSLLSVEPGQTITSIRHAYHVGSLSSGHYRVELTYDVNYPTHSRTWSEVAYVTSNVSTSSLPVASATHSLTAFSVSPSEGVSGGRMYANFSLGQPAVVTARLYDGHWRLVTVGATSRRGAGPGSVRIYLNDSRGHALAAGGYFLQVRASNSRGISTQSSSIVVH